MEGKQIKRKVLLLGDGAVGKTSLIKKFVTDKFDDKYITTIGTKITKKDLRFKTNQGEVLLTLLIWDILGQKGYTSVQASSYRGGEGVMVVCDLTRKDTLTSLKEYWIPELEKVVGNVPKVFVGNKCDLVEDAEITSEELGAMAEEYGSKHFLSSAKTGENVEALFILLGEQVLEAGASHGKKPVDIEEKTVSNLLEVTDKIINDFCKAHGDIDTAMAMIRQQFSSVGLDVKAPTKEPLMKAVERLAELEMELGDEFKVKATLAKRKRMIEEFG